MPIHPTAVVDPRATVHPTAEIGPYAVIDGPAIIGPDCRLGPFAVVLGVTELGAGCQVHARAVVGDVPQDRSFTGEESYVRVGAGTVIREGVTIHRGTTAGTATVIGANCLLMTNAHVGHNCIVEDGVVLVSGALLGGHVRVGRGAIVSGNAAIHQFVRIGELAMISGLAKITQDIPPFCMTDRDGHVVGVNSVGLRRAGLSSAERIEIKAAFRILYRSEQPHAAAIALLRDAMHSPAGLRIVEFFGDSGNRGMAKGRQRARQAA